MMYLLPSPLRKQFPFHFADRRTQSLRRDKQGSGGGCQGGGAGNLYKILHLFNTHTVFLSSRYHLHHNLTEKNRCLCSACNKIFPESYIWGLAAALTA